eukprot:98132-Pelagomonas_calceolata.AAC.1
MGSPNLRNSNNKNSSSSSQQPTFNDLWKAWHHLLLCWLASKLNQGGRLASWWVHPKTRHLEIFRESLASFAIVLVGLQSESRRQGWQGILGYPLWAIVLLGRKSHFEEASQALWWVYLRTGQGILALWAIVLLGRKSHFEEAGQATWWVYLRTGQGILAMLALAELGHISDSKRQLSVIVGASQDRAGDSGNVGSCRVGPQQ